MTCYSPLTGYYSADLTAKGKRAIVFRNGGSFSGLPVRLPCGQCIGCRLKKSQDWAIRCMHEVQMHDVSCFVTLTYDDDHLPEGGTLVKRDLQLFMKRLRKSRSERIRFYAGGEYGDNFSRPHYHLLLFGTDFKDKRPRRSGRAGHPLFDSGELRELWPYGHNVIGAVEAASAAYVARYCLKKVTGPAAQAHYLVQTEDGVLVQREPEFAVMSRRPGLGAMWFDKFGMHSYEFDTVVLNGREVKSPRYYDSLLAKVDEGKLRGVKKDRLLSSIDGHSENTYERRRVRECVVLAGLSSQRRDT